MFSRSVGLGNLLNKTPLTEGEAGDCFQGSCRFIHTKYPSSLLGERVHLGRRTRPVAETAWLVVIPGRPRLSSLPFRGR